MNIKIKNIILKKNKAKIVCLTAYSKSISKILDNFCDIILVGDSMANVLYGHKNTHKINLENIIQHSTSVKKGIKKSLLVVDMPKGTYDNVKSALKNAKIILKKTKCDAVKLENNRNNFKIIKNLVKKKVPVMGHSRTYEYICLLRAVTSEDGMTADYFTFPEDFLDKISNKIINNVKGINRVVYDITSKPPSTIELE